MELRLLTELQELLKRYGLAEKDLEKQISDLHLQLIISSVTCSDWRSLPAHLDLPSSTIEDIDQSQRDEEKKREDFLRQWKEIKGDGATYKQLIAAFLKTRCGKDAEEVCKIFKSSVSTSTGTTASAAQTEPQKQTPSVNTSGTSVSCNCRLLHRL